MNQASRRVSVVVGTVLLLAAASFTVPTGATAQAAFVCTQTDSQLAWSGTPTWATAQDVRQDNKTVKYLGKAARSWSGATSAGSTYSIVAKRSGQSVSASCNSSNPTATTVPTTPTVPTATTVTTTTRVTGPGEGEVDNPSVLPPSMVDSTFQERMALAGELTASLHRTHPQTFNGGSWVDDGHTFVLRFTVAPGAAVNAEIANKLPGVNVAVVNSPASRQELLQLKSKIAESLVQPMGTFEYGVGIDLEDATVVVNLPSGQDRSTLAAVGEATTAVNATVSQHLSSRQRVPGAPVEQLGGVGQLVTIVGGDLDPTVDFRHGKYTRGGEWLQTPDGVCTSGFLMSKYKNGRRYHRMTSAGHCYAKPGDPFIGNTVVGGNRGWMSHWDGTNIGRIWLNFYKDEGTDLLMFSLGSRSTNRSRVTTSSNTYRSVTGKKQAWQMNHNDQQCFIGHGSAKRGYNQKCGKLKIQNYDWHDEDAPAGHMIRDLNCLERKSHGGDSGGPIFYEDGSSGALAAGSLVGNLELDRRWPVRSLHYTCYHTIGQIERDGWRVKTW